MLARHAVGCCWSCCLFEGGKFCVCEIAEGTLRILQYYPETLAICLIVIDINLIFIKPFVGCAKKHFPDVPVRRFAIDNVSAAQ